MQDQSKKTQKTYAIGLDLGGTFIKYALVDSEGECLIHSKLPSLAEVSAEAVIGQLIKAAEETQKYAMEQGYTVQGIGIGTPGIIDDTERIVAGAAENIRGWENIPLADRIEEKLSLPVRVGNDANLMGLGETLHGAGRGCSHVVFLTVGTGIGGAVVIDYKLFNGFANRGTELGHIALMAEGEICACGATGCLEAYASANALVRQYQKALQALPVRSPEQITPTNAEQIIQLYLKQDPLAITCMEKHFYFLGRGIGGLINIFSPQRIVIGGGLAEAGPFYIEHVAREALRQALPACAVNTSIVGAALGNRAGSIGAAARIFQVQSTQEKSI